MQNPNSFNQRGQQRGYQANDVGYQEDMMKMMTKSPQTEVSDENGVTIYLYEDITLESTNRVQGEIYKHAGLPMTLRIKTFGGSLLDANGLVDAIEKFDVNTHVDGYAMSAGFLIFCAGHTRTAEPNALFMFHGMSYGMWGNIADHEEELEVSKILNDDMIKNVMKHTALPEEKLREVVNAKKAWHFGYEESKDYYMITHEIAQVERVVMMPEYIELPNPNEEEMMELSDEQVEEIIEQMEEGMDGRLSQKPADSEVNEETDAKK